MKRKFSKIVFLFGIMYLFTTNVNAFELTYSEWSETYPENISENFIEKEDRFYWYKNNEVDIEYLIKEDIGNKLYDENDIKYYTSEELFEKPKEYSERIINENYKSIKYTPDDVKGVLITTNDNAEISEIDIRDLDSNRIECKAENEKLYDDDIKTYYQIDNSIYCFFNNKLNYQSFTSFISMKSDSKATIKFNLISENNDIIYYTSLSFNGKSDYTMFNSNMLMSNLNHSKVYYIYTDKLYKTYNLEKEYVNEYYKELDGYQKDESTKKTFYRYITNDYIVVNEDGDLITNEDYCIKNFCKLLYLVEKEEPKIIENPKTLDNIYNYILVLFICFVSLLIIVKKCHMIKKSNIVESI